MSSPLLTDLFLLYNTDRQIQSSSSFSGLDLFYSFIYWIPLQSKQLIYSWINKAQLFFNDVYVHETAWACLHSHSNTLCSKTALIAANECRPRATYFMCARGATPFCWKKTLLRVSFFTPAEAMCARNGRVNKRPISLTWGIVIKPPLPN